MKISYGILFTLSAFFLLQFCSPELEQEPEVIPTMPMGVDNSEENYQELCGGCHGRRLGTFVNRNWIYGCTKDEIIHSIAKGYESDGMPAFENSLSSAEIEDLADYLLRVKDSLFVEDPTPPNLIFESQYFSYSLDTIATDLGIPWGMDFLPDGRILVSDRGGVLFIIDEGIKTEIKGLPPIASVGQGGLMDIKLHPDYINNPWVYLSYTKENNNEEYTTAIMRIKIQDHQVIESEQIFEALPYFDTPVHFGSRIVFDADGYLYFGVGDRGFRDDNPQNLENHSGKIHRLNDDGSIPDDNPFFNHPTAKKSIFSYGHRNPQGMCVHPVTGEIWETEHGPRGGDEINIIEAGLNYGWPVISYGINYDGTSFTELTEMEGMEQPISYWTPSIAPCGMAFVTGNLYPEWKGDILSGSLSFEYLHRSKVTNGAVVEDEKLVDYGKRVRNVKMGLDGYIYVALEDPGYLYRIVPL